MFVKDRLRKTKIFKLYVNLNYKIKRHALPHKRKLFWEAWKNTNNKERFSDFINAHLGAERCFIIGNGPSLTAKDLDKLTNEITFSSNKIYKCFGETKWRPYYYVIDDRHYVQDVKTNITVPSVQTFIALEDNRKLLKKYEGSKAIVLKKVTNIVNGLPQISKNFNEYLGSGYTVALAQFQLAVAMGIKKIYFIGTDCSYSNNSSGKTNWFYGSDGNANVSTADSGNIFRAFYAIKNYADKNGIEVYNATRGGALEVFPRVALDTLI